MSLERVVRWRLILGEASQLCLGNPCLSESVLEADAALSWLYDRELAGEERDIRAGAGGGCDGRPGSQAGTDGTGASGEGKPGSEGGRHAGGRRGGRGPSTLTVPQWVNNIHRLFPRETIERMERDAVERYQIHEVVTNREVLKRVQPSLPLLAAVLRLKHLMNPEVLDLARELVRRVVRELMEKLAREIQRTFSGARLRQRSTPLKVSRDLDARRTIHENLRHYSQEEQRIYVERPFFFPRGRKSRLTWQVILLVDQSGSMANSVIHSAVTAACLWGLPSIRTHLCVFDTKVVDLTHEITDPVEVLMKVQLGGGTDIRAAVAYGASLIDTPRRTILVIISDFFEGGDAGALVRTVRSLCQEGTTVLGLAALDREAVPCYDEGLARRLVEAGAEVGAMTPLELAAWIAEKVRS